MSQVPRLYFYPFLCKLGLKMTVKINYLLQFQTIYHAKLSYQIKLYFTATKNTRVTACPIWEVLDAPYCSLGVSDRGLFWKIIVCMVVFGDFICAEHTSEQGFSPLLQELLPKNV